MHILAVIVAINAFVVGAFAVTMPAPQGLLPNAGNVNSYANNCNSLKINAKHKTMTLAATCLNDEDNSWGTTEIDLNHCIANNFGKMEARAEGHFAYTCQFSNFGYTPGPEVDSYLWTYCYNGSQRAQVYSKIDLGTFIELDNGMLSCFGIKGSSHHTTV